MVITIDGNTAYNDLLKPVSTYLFINERNDDCRLFGPNKNIT